MDYLPGWNRRANGTRRAVVFSHTSPSWKVVIIGYGYGVDAIRANGRGAQSIGVLLQFDLGHAREALLNPEEPGRWRGFQQMFDIFGK